MECVKIVNRVTKPVGGTREKYLEARKELEEKKAAKMSKFHMDCAMNAVQYAGGQVDAR